MMYGGVRAARQQLAPSWLQRHQLVRFVHLFGQGFVCASQVGSRGWRSRMRTRMVGPRVLVWCRRTGVTHGQASRRLIPVARNHQTQIFLFISRVGYSQIWPQRSVQHEGSPLIQQSGIKRLASSQTCSGSSRNEYKRLKIGPDRRLEADGRLLVMSLTVGCIGFHLHSDSFQGRRRSTEPPQKRKVRPRRAGRTFLAEQTPGRWAGSPAQTEPDWANCVWPHSFQLEHLFHLHTGTHVQDITASQ